MKKIFINEGIPEIENYAFENQPLEEIALPNITRIGDYAFSGCTGLKNIVIPDSVREIGAAAFMHCTSLTNVVIPDGVIKINERAFSGCTALESIVIPESVKEIADWTFAGCSRLREITIPQTIEIGRYAFSDCLSLKRIIFRGTKDEWEILPIGIGNDPLFHIHVEFAAEGSAK